LKTITIIRIFNYINSHCYIDVGVLLIEAEKKEGNTEIVGFLGDYPGKNI